MSKDKITYTGLQVNSGPIKLKYPMATQHPEISDHIRAQFAGTTREAKLAKAWQEGRDADEGADNPYLVDGHGK